MNTKIKTILTLLTLIITLSFGGKTIATEKQTNPFGLVYQGAITANEAGKVNIKPVNYQLNGLKISANIYLPANFDENKKYPVIVIAHPNGGVKEQVAGLYAQKLAENGYITLVADASYQGASEGIPRHTDKPYFRENDIHGMVDHILQYSNVDTERVGILGICGGGGYTLKASQSDKRLKAVVTLSMFNSGRVRRNGYNDSQLDTVQERLEKAVKARNEELTTGKVKLIGKMDFSDEAIAKLPFDLYKEGAIYYGRTHAHPNSTFEYTEASLMDLMTWDATDQIELINQPLLLIAGEKADSLYMSKDAFEKATGTEDKELFLIPEATHIQTYYVPEYVEKITAKLVGFFNEKLNKNEIEKLPEFSDENGDVKIDENLDEKLLESSNADVIEGESEKIN